MSKRMDLTGQRFGRLVVTKFFGNIPAASGHIERMWSCLCDCGKIVKVRARTLRAGHTKSCGCLKADSAFTANRKHGYFGTTEYRSWSSMIHRCTNPKAPNWSGYGGRGITVCERWKSFPNFIEDMGDKPTPEHSIDRIDVNGNYEPENCRWASRSEQQRNKRNSVMLTIGNVTKTLIEWSEIGGVKSKTIAMRLSQGCSHAEAVFKPVKRLLNR